MWAGMWVISGGIHLGVLVLSLISVLDCKNPNGMVVFVCLFVWLVYKKGLCVSVAGFRSTRLLPIHLW